MAGVNFLGARPGGYNNKRMIGPPVGPRKIASMLNDRPNPDAILARVQAESARAGRGKLKIFFGYAAGVGKTFEMLSAAQRERAAGTDVVVGYVEPHGRPETEALLKGLETLPLLGVTYRGATLREFELDAA